MRSTPFVVVAAVLYGVMVHEVYDRATAAHRETVKAMAAGCMMSERIRGDGWLQDDKPTSMDPLTFTADAVQSWLSPPSGAVAFTTGPWQGWTMRTSNGGKTWYLEPPKHWTGLGVPVTGMAGYVTSEACGHVYGSGGVSWVGDGPSEKLAAMSGGDVSVVCRNHGVQVACDEATATRNPPAPAQDRITNSTPTRYDISPLMREIISKAPGVVYVTPSGIPMTRDKWEPGDRMVLADSMRGDVYQHKNGGGVYIRDPPVGYVPLRSGSGWSTDDDEE